MSQNQRFREGQQNVAKGLIQAGVKAQIGDLVMLLGGYVVPASLLAAGSSYPEFKTVFFGVLIEGATAGTETHNTQCLVGTSGVYEYPVPTALSQGYAPGSPFEPVEESTIIADQKLQYVAARTNAIALLAKQAYAGDLTVFVQIFSSVMGPPLA